MSKHTLANAMKMQPNSKMTCEKYIATIPKGIADYDELVHRTRAVFDAAASAQIRHTIPNSSIDLPTVKDVELTTSPMQPEALLEEKLMTFLDLCKGYERLAINNEDELAANFREQVSAFNHIAFTDSEWTRFLIEFAKSNRTVEERTRAVYHGANFTRDDGSACNIWFQDSKDPSRNIFQVVHQVRGTDITGRATRYDVTILVNGLPRVHFELKRPGVGIQKAFGQIDRYIVSSFTNSKYDLYGFVSLFVISNGKHTRYYSNSTRTRCVKAQASKASGRSNKKNKAAKLWTNTFMWKTTDNLPVGDLISFADTFCDKTSLSYILGDYCTITIDDELFVAKSYQIAAAEGMFNKVVKNFHQGCFNGSDANGYVWHATGSGKTFTSFLTSKLLSRHLHIRTNFLVDRKDLDSQTVREYNRFDSDCVTSNKSSREMRTRLEDLHQDLVVGIINKMSIIVSKAMRKSKASGEPLPAFFYLPCVFIFDECHRSQFGHMQVAIQKAFKLYIEFGITGTPIFPENRHKGSINATTADIFGEELHCYSITSAISDGAVLPYRIHNVPSRLLSLLPEGLGEVPEKPRVFTMTPARIAANSEFILDHHPTLVHAMGLYKYR